MSCARCARRSRITAELTLNFDLLNTSGVPANNAQARAWNAQKLGQCHNHAVVGLAVNSLFSHINNETGLTFINDERAFCAAGFNPNDESLGSHG